MSQRIIQRATEIKIIQEQQRKDREYLMFEAEQLKAKGPAFWRQICSAVQIRHRTFNEEFSSKSHQIDPFIATPGGFRLHRGHYPAVDVSVTYNAPAQSIECVIVKRPNSNSEIGPEINTFPLRLAKTGDIEVNVSGIENHGDFADWFFEQFYEDLC